VGCKQCQFSAIQVVARTYPLTTTANFGETYRARLAATEIEFAKKSDFAWNFAIRGNYISEPAARIVVNHPNIPAILRQLSETGPPVTDAELLGRYAVHRDEDAFAALVRRHGRLVWAVCQHLAGSDADDAFQATFLVLLRNAGNARVANRLSAWLYGVAYRVCLKARQSARRRMCREQAVAVKDHGSSVVPDSVWDRALAAVHEEVFKLPETLRVPFVLCTLEGKSVTEAAEQLGWKLSTLSARLRRAKDSLLSRLATRGITAGSVVTLACTATSAPADVLAKTSKLAHSAVIVSSSILQLSQGVIGMSAYQVKMLAAVVLLAIGLGIGSRSGWLASAEAQQAAPAEKLTPDEKVRRLEQQLAQAVAEAEEARRLEEARRREAELKERNSKLAGSLSTAKWEYSFVPASPMEASKFVKFLQEQEARGWDYSGQTTLVQQSKDTVMWVFRRPTKQPLGIQSNPFQQYNSFTNDPNSSSTKPAGGTTPPATTPPDLRP
jgi:RNA polymerase sigma factor (sigma-70 family)